MESWAELAGDSRLPASVPAGPEPHKDLEADTEPEVDTGRQPNTESPVPPFSAVLAQRDLEIQSAGKIPASLRVSSVPLVPRVWLRRNARKGKENRNRQSRHFDHSICPKENFI